MINYRINKVFLLILMNGISVLFISLGIFFILNSNNITYNVKIFNKELRTNSSTNEFTEILDDVEANLHEKKFVNLELNDNLVYKLSLDDIDLELDKNETIDNYQEILDEKEKKGIFNYFDERSLIVKPSIKYDKSKLNYKIETLKRVINKFEKNALIEIENDNIKKIPEKLGKKLNIQKLTEKIENSIINYNYNRIKIDEGDIDRIEPEITLKDINDINNILSQCTINFDKLSFDSEVIEKISNNLDGKFLKRNDKLSFIEDVLNNNSNYLNDLESDFMVSLLNLALMKAGFYEEIKGCQNNSIVDYFMPGLDMNIGNRMDYVFTNKSDTPIIIKTKAYSDKILIYILGNRLDEISYDIKVDIKDIEKSKSKYIVVESLGREEEKIVNEGKDGLSAEVYKVIYYKNNFVGTQFLYKNKYSPKERIIYIGNKEFSLEK